MSIESRFVFKEKPGHGGLGLQCVALRAPEGSDVLIKIHSASICGTDLHIYKWNAWAACAYQPPFRIGHEFGGAVVDVGPGVHAIKPGDHVTAETHIACGHCHQCRLNRRHTCENLQLFSRLGFGCFSDPTLVPEAVLRVVPPDIPLELATIMEPLGVSVRAVAEARVGGARILILGSGPIGLFAILAARAYGAAHIVATDLSQYRLGLAQRMGADQVGNSSLLMGLARSSRDKFDIVIDTTGNEEAVVEALEDLRSGGHLIFASLPSHPFHLDVARHIVLREICVSGVYGRRLDETWIEVERLLRNRGAEISAVVTHRFGLADFAAAFDLAASGQSGKVVFEPAVKRLVD